MAQQKTTKKTGKPLAHGVGRRRKAIARTWLRRGNGKIIVNGKDYLDYFSSDVERREAAAPFSIFTEVAKNYDATINVSGGGLLGQAGAVKLGISRALVEANEDMRSDLRQHGLLTVDSRRKERKKPGQKGARAKFQFVKR